MTFRNYQKASRAVQDNYHQARLYQTVSYVEDRISEYQQRTKERLSIWAVIEKLSNFIDVSDPDVDLPNAHHLFQAAEAARLQGEEDWFVLTCLIHDIGKIMYKWGRDRDGTSIKHQWGIVGDTFLVGLPVPDTIVYPEFNREREELLANQDHQHHNYLRNCGLDNTLVSWGHDEYLYRVLTDSNNKNRLPEIAKKIIRYHSLYLWHQKNEYGYLENEPDRLLKPWVQRFNQYDLYTKENLEKPIHELQDYYQQLFLKFFDTEYLYF